jgi:hypothetical protein
MWRSGKLAGASWFPNNLPAPCAGTDYSFVCRPISGGRESRCVCWAGGVPHGQIDREDWRLEGLFPGRV